MAQRRGVQVVLLVLALLVQVEQGAVQQGIILRTIHGKTGGLVHNDDLRAVIHHLCRAAGILPRRAVHTAVRIQNFIQNEQLDLITGHHAGGKRLLFAVQLDLVLPQGLVQAARVQCRVLLHQVVVQPGWGQDIYF